MLVDLSVFIHPKADIKLGHGLIFHRHLHAPDNLVGHAPEGCPKNGQHDDHPYFFLEVKHQSF